jgi:diguanylate cyclase (GGDEF)-like protein
MGESPRRERDLEPATGELRIDPGSGLRLRSAEEDPYRSVFRLSPKPMWIHDATSLAFLDVNDAAVSEYGYTRDEFLAMTMADVGECGTEVRHRRKDGSTFEAETCAEEVWFAGRAARLVLTFDVSERRRAEAKITHDALHDALTGLPNRMLFLERLRVALIRAKRRRDYVFAVLLVDLDRFKVINEGLGHTAGDLLLVEAARVLETCVRPQDTVARLGGDEFTVLLDDVRDELYATRVANRIHRALLTPFDLDGHEAFTTASIGIALSSASYERAEDVMRDADTAMYRAKALGKARHEIFDTSMHRRAVALMQVETDIRRAIERAEFSLAYQPIVSLRTGQLEGFEALLRWDHPQRGPVPPIELVPVAEETGLIQNIGRWVLGEACQEMRRWLDASGPVGARDLFVCVNLSGKQFQQPGLTREIADAMQANGLEPRRLKLEITESALMHDPEQAAAMMRELRAQGCGLSIDDFGTGYSSLSYLLRFPIDTLKIDRTFVSGMEKGGENQELVRTIVTLARNLSMHVVAEGVETEAQRIRLEALGCDSAQGFLFSEPVTGNAAQGLIGSFPRAP